MKGVFRPLGPTLQIDVTAGYAATSNPTPGARAYRIVTDATSTVWVAWGTTQAALAAIEGSALAMGIPVMANQPEYISVGGAYIVGGNQGDPNPPVNFIGITGSAAQGHIFVTPGEIF